MNAATQILQRFGATVLRVVLVVLLALLGVMIAGAVSAQTVPQATELLEDAEAAVQAETARFNELRLNYERELAVVNALRSGGALNAFSQTTLREALRQANSSADSLALADAARLTAVAERDAAAETLSAALQDEMDQIETSLLSRLDAASLASAVEELNRLSERRAALAQRVASETVSVPISEILADLPETAEEMLAAADELADHAARLEAELAYWTSEAEIYDTQRRILTRSNEYRVQDDLFGDGTADPTARQARGATATADEAAGEGDASEETPSVEADGDSGGAQDTPVVSAPVVDGANGTPPGRGEEEGEFTSDPETDGANEPELGMEPGGDDALSPGEGGGPTIAFVPGRELPISPTTGGASLVDARDSSDPTVRAVDTQSPESLLRDAPPAITSPRQRRDAIAAELEAVRAEQERLLRGASALQE